MNGSASSRFLLGVLLALVGLTGQVRGEPTPPEGVSSKWWKHVRCELAASEYSIHGHERAAGAPTWVANNAHHGFRAEFEEQRVQITPWTPTLGLSWEFGFTLSLYSRAGRPGPVADPTVTVSDNRVELYRVALTEWYVNTAQGLQQGFTLHEPPTDSTGAARLGPVLLGVELHGDLAAYPSSDGRAIDLRGPVCAGRR